MATPIDQYLNILAKKMVLTYISAPARLPVQNFKAP
jgi:hypothetical protein